MIPNAEIFSEAITDAAEMCGAVAVDVDLTEDNIAFIWCGPGVVVGIEIEPGMTPEDVFVETLIMIELSDDPEFNCAEDDPPDSPIWNFEQVGELTPAQRAQTGLWVEDERSIMAANPQRFRH